MKTARTKFLSLVLILLVAPGFIQPGPDPSRGRGGRNGQPLELG